MCSHRLCLALRLVYCTAMRCLRHILTVFKNVCACECIVDIVPGGMHLLRVLAKHFLSHHARLMHPTACAAVMMAGVASFACKRRAGSM